MHEHPIANEPRENIAHLSHSLEKALGQNSALLEDMVRFTRNESVRLARMHLDQAGIAFAPLLERRDLGSILSAQQEWVKQMMQEYATLGLRYAEMFQGMTQQVRSHVQAAASDLQHQVAEEAHETERTLEKNMPHIQPGLNGGHASTPAE